MELRNTKAFGFFDRDMYETYAYRPSLYYNIKGTLTRRISAIFLLLPKDKLDARIRCLEGCHRGSPYGIHHQKT